MKDPYFIGLGWYNTHCIMIDINQEQHGSQVSVSLQFQIQNYS